MPHRAAIIGVTDVIVQSVSTHGHETILLFFDAGAGAAAVDNTGHLLPPPKCRYKVSRPESLGRACQRGDIV